ncbi:hypothetical protein GV832_12845 [Rhodobacteraceae bacterium CYK-10]|uniref:Uncharacterized protein n=1 Tax=Stagnihabitans tardus TaxID=2699202 RepID=A0AAE5BWN6_9RHOB|nr:hypothetical protein [Stagnihabitans tardus]NBZ88473.1 hypothetical protein [Stagnihabitans tardus]
MTLPLCALAEIAGCSALWSWWRGASALWLIPGAAALTSPRRDSGPRQDWRHPIANRWRDR